MKDRYYSSCRLKNMIEMLPLQMQQKPNPMNF